MKGYKGFNADMTCRDKQYEIGGEYAEPEAKLCEAGLHFCELPHAVFNYYSAGQSKFCEVDGENVDDERGEDSKRVCKHLKVGAEICATHIAQIAVKAFFEKFEFADKIAKKKEKNAANAGDCGAANAGDWGAANAGNRGAANAGDCGAANAGYCGAANAGYCGAANAGDCGAANAGNRGAANAGNRGAANAGNRGAANAGDCGAAISGKDGKSSVGESGVAITSNGQAKGQFNAILVLVERDNDWNVINYKAVVVDGEIYKPDVWYKLENSDVVEV